MRYYMDEHSIDLSALQRRLQSMDLIPSHEPIRAGLAEKLFALKEAGVHSVGDLRIALKTAKSQASLSEKSGVDADYLRLLRRVIEGFFPKPRPVREMDWLDGAMVDTLIGNGIKNMRDLFEKAAEGAADLARSTGLDQEELQELVAIADVCRVQWVSPTYARALVAAGYANAAAIAAADPETLCCALAAANENAKFYNGKVGLRDIRRLVAASAYVP